MTYRCCHVKWLLNNPSTSLNCFPLKIRRSLDSLFEGRPLLQTWYSSPTFGVPLIQRLLGLETTITWTDRICWFGTEERSSRFLPSQGIRILVTPNATMTKNTEEPNILVTKQGTVGGNNPERKTTHNEAFWFFRSPN
jgi:hypothetical protein